MNEREAIRRMSEGDVGGLEPLVAAYQLRAVRAAYLVTHDRAQAEDIVQHAFVRAFERIGQLRPNHPFGPWFLRSVVNDALKAAERDRRWGAPTADPTVPDWVGAPLDPSPGPEETLLARELRTEIWAALALLTPELRAAVVLRYFLDLREGEVAAWLETPGGTVKWRLHEARRRLRGLLSSRGDPTMAVSPGRGPR